MKAKGDRREREAVAFLVENFSQHCRPNARRKLGAGRHDDMGDLDVFDDVAIQVRTRAVISTAIRTAASDAAIQAMRSGARWHFGMVPIPYSRNVKWLAASTVWPGGGGDDAPVFGITENAVAHIKRGGSLALIRRNGAVPMWIGTVASWIDAWQSEVGQCSA